ncbi:MAG: hypothetical protein ACOCQR_03140 [bacterium]
MIGIVIKMSAESHQNVCRNIWLIPNVNSHDEAYKLAKRNFNLGGDWAEQVGVTLVEDDFQNIIDIPHHWESYDVQYINGKRNDGKRVEVMHVTIGFLQKQGLFDKYCEVSGMSPWAINEGRVRKDEKVGLTQKEVEQLGFL